MAVMDTRDHLVTIVEHIRAQAIIEKLEFTRREAFSSFAVCEYTSIIYASRLFYFNIDKFSIGIAYCLVV